MQTTIDAIIKAASSVILGKEQQIKLSLTCLLAGGHLLIEDLPGMGKTTLAHTLAQVLGLSFRRAQFTSDLLPAEIIGVSVYDQTAASFQFHPGPIFTQVLLADEINRATPKTQSALLEAMEEYQVTIDGHAHPLPKPFFVIATQNPKHHIGTFPLPESQLDRFLMRIQIGYPDEKSERALLQDKGIVPKDKISLTEQDYNDSLIKGTLKNNQELFNHAFRRIHLVHRVMASAAAVASSKSEALAISRPVKSQIIV
jgi:MoxR-like ATPase